MHTHPKATKNEQTRQEPGYFALLLSGISDPFEWFFLLLKNPYGYVN